MFKDRDFVEIDYIARIKASGQVFDFTVKDIADSMKLAGDYKPVVIVLGAGHVIPGLDAEIRKHKIGDEFNVDILPEHAFGIRNPKLVQLIPMRKFKKDKVEPYPGMRVSVDTRFGTVRSSSGGRVIVDFNHPLAGRELSYWVKIHRKLVNKSEKIDGLLRFHGLKDFKKTMAKGKLVIRTKSQLPDVIKKLVSEQIATYINIRTVNFDIQKVDKDKDDRSE